jgi:putative phosphoesterase
MRLGVLGDIHAEHARLEVALALFARERVDQVLFVGDVVDGEGNPSACFAMLEDAKALGVQGNHERWLAAGTMRTLPGAHTLDQLDARALRVMRELPKTRAIDTPRGRLLLCHGVGDDDMQRLRPHDDDYAIRWNDPLQALLREGGHAFMVGGHTHERMVRGFEELVVINAGTLAREQPDAGVVVIDLEAREASFHAFAGEALVPADVCPLRPKVTGIGLSG